MTGDHNGPMQGIGSRVRAMLARDNPETGIAIRLLGTAVLIGVLLTTRPGATPGWAWWLYGAAFACWLCFVLLDPRLPRLSLWALALAATLPTLAFTAAGDGTPVFLTCIALGAFASHGRPSIAMIVPLTCVDLALPTASALRWPVSAGDLAGDAAALLVVALFGLARRQFLVQAQQTELLLRQTRLAQRERERAAALDERARIAREMHDVLAHALGALGVQLEVAETLLAERSDVAGALERVRRSRRLAAEGRSNADIAATLFIGKTTVKTHINNAFAKIGATIRSNAVRYVFQHGIAT